MGIFNPRASVTTSSNGFSPFAVSAAVCNRGGLTVAFSVGPIPNGASSLTLDNLTLSSPSGFSSTFSTTLPSTDFSPASVTSGGSFTFTSPSTINCSTSGVPFSVSGSLDYTYTSTAGKVTTSATGTIAGKSS